VKPGEVAEARGRSSTSFEDAIKSAIARLDRTLHSVRSLWLKSRYVREAAGAPREYEVELWITFIGADWEVTQAPRRAV
jgi:flavin-binding protein dodecin